MRRGVLYTEDALNLYSRKLGMSDETSETAAWLLASHNIKFREVARQVTALGRLPRAT